jgi:hypothetical protein
MDSEIGSGSVVDHAVATLRALRATIERQIDGIAIERTALREGAWEKLFDHSLTRQQLNAEIAWLTQELTAAFKILASERGLSSSSVRLLAKASPELTPILVVPFDQVLSRARELASLDETNQILLKRSLAVVRGARSALAPAPVAYDRRGTRAPEWSRTRALQIG